MSGPISIQCPTCRAKLKLKNDSAVGKKVPCPKCKKPFVVMAPPEPEDEWDEFGGLDDFDSYGDEYDEAPVAPRRRTSASKKSKGKTSKNKKRRKNAGSPGWVKPVIIGFGALAALSLMIGVGFVGVRMLGGGAAAANNKINLAYLPPDSELFFVVNIDAARQAPLMQTLLNSDAVKPQLAQMAQKSGIKLEDIESIVVGSSGLSEAAKQLPDQAGNPMSPMSLAPNLNSLPTIIVIRTRVPVDVKLANSTDGRTELKEHAGQSYFLSPATRAGRLPVGGYQPDNKTLVMGNEADLKAAIDRGSKQQRRADLDFINEKHHLLIVTIPKNPQSLTGKQNKVLASLPSQFESLRSKLDGKILGSCIGLTVTDGVQLELQGVCQAATDAVTAEKEISTLLQEGNQKLAETAASLPPSVSGVINVAKSILDKVQVSADGATFALNASISGADIDTIKKEAAPLMMAGVMGGLGGGGMPPLDGETPPSSGILPEGSILGNAFDKASAAGAAAQCRNNLKQIGLAFHNYHDNKGHFPAAASVDKSGKKLLSWRVHVLPFLDHQALYNQFHLNEAWDSPHNKQLLAKIPPVYACPSGHLKPGMTTYLGIAGEGAFLAGTKSSTMSQFTDGLTYTLLVVDAAESRAVPWTKPADYEYVKEQPMEGLIGNHKDEFHGLGGDGAVHKFPADYNKQQLAGLYTIGGRDVNFAPLPAQRPRTPTVIKQVIPKTEEDRFSLCHANFKRLGLAFHNFHDVHGHFPPAEGGWDGKSNLSWRVYLLPYLDAPTLAEEFHYDEPWDSPHNKSLIERMPPAFACPSAKLKPGMTTYLGISGEKAFFNGKVKLKMRDITDGLSNTALVVEVDASRAVIWTKPDDFAYSEKNPSEGLVGRHSRGFNMLMGDGSVRLMSPEIEVKTLKALFTFSGGEKVSPAGR